MRIAEPKLRLRRRNLEVEEPAEPRNVESEIYLGMTRRGRSSSITHASVVCMVLIAQARSHVCALTAEFTNFNYAATVQRG